MDNKKIVKLNLKKKIKKIVKISKNNNLKIFEKKKDKIKLRSMKLIDKEIIKIKNKKVKESMNKFKGGNVKYKEIKIINDKLLKDIKEIDSLKEEVSSIEDTKLLNEISNLIDFNISSTESETYIETFEN